LQHAQRRCAVRDSFLFVWMGNIDPTLQCRSIADESAGSPFFSSLDDPVLRCAARPRSARRRACFGSWPAFTSDQRVPGDFHARGGRGSNPCTGISVQSSIQLVWAGGRCSSLNNWVLWCG
jgi:hypothetical protein